jgi:hypothetical protein
MTQGQSPEESPTVEAAWCFYSSARAELLQRVNSRDSTQFLFMAGSATLFSIALSTKTNEVLYAVPLLGLGVGQLYCHHSIIIGALGKYVGVELDGWLKTQLPGSAVPPQWDNSRALLGLENSHLRRILSSGYFLILLPEVLALLVASLGHQPTPIDYAGLSFGIVAVIVSFVIITSAYRIRRRQLSDTAAYAASAAS